MVPLHFCWMDDLSSGRTRRDSSDRVYGQCVGGVVRANPNLLRIQKNPPTTARPSSKGSSKSLDAAFIDAWAKSQNISHQPESVDKQTLTKQIIKVTMTENDNSKSSPAESAPSVEAMEEASAKDMEWLTASTLVVVVVGASGDLAKKKTYPSLLNLYDSNLLPKDTVIIGFARSQLTDDELRDRLRPFLEKTDHSKEVVEKFLDRCVYQGGKSYGDLDAFEELKGRMESFESEHTEKIKHNNRLYYFAIPPNVFADTGLAIKKKGMQDENKGWTRLIVEKPFGRDLESFEELNKTLSAHFTEEHLYRIDHYLGKEMVQNLTVLRFSNIWFERVWNAQNIQCVILTFKEPFGTDGRGGYFDKYGIIRDILQNHLLQVMTLLAMETPTKLEGDGASNAIRNAKVAVLQAIEPIREEDVVLGQYEGYADDPTIENKETNVR